MSASSGKPDDSGRLNDDSLSDGALKYAPKRAQRPEPPENPNNVAPGVKTRLPPDEENPSVQPWKRRKQREGVAGDIAVVELRTRLALAPDRIAEPQPPEFPARAFGGAGRAIGVIAVVTMAAGGYWLGQSPRTTPLPRQPAAIPGRADVAQDSFASASDHKSPSRDSQPIGVRPATSGLVSGAAVDAARELTPGATAVAARRGVPPADPPPRQTDAVEIARMIKQGEQFMANADIAGARLVFQRAAEAGDAAAAVALGETYDPLVLGKSGKEGGITSDTVAARRWYEKARELGSTIAQERIARLLQAGQ